MQDIEFDQFDLEQLAESLLEDVSSNLETNVAPAGGSNAQSQSCEQRLSEPLVGTNNSRMESPHDKSRKLNTFTDDVTPKTTFEFDETYNKGIIYADDIPVAEKEEECLEINDDDVCMAFKSEPMDGLISPIPSTDYEHIKSPLTSVSDCGYESHGSPLSIQDFTFNDQRDDLNYLLNDLFPALA